MMSYDVIDLMVCSFELAHKIPGCLGTAWLRQDLEVLLGNFARRTLSRKQLGQRHMALTRACGSTIGRRRNRGATEASIRLFENEVQAKISSITRLLLFSFIFHFKIIGLDSFPDWFLETKPWDLMLYPVKSKATGTWGAQSANPISHPQLRSSTVWFSNDIIGHSIGPVKT